MSREALSSASGLRPMSAFVVVGGVVLAVAFWVLRLSIASVEQPDRRRSQHAEPPAYSIADRDGQAIARFVPRFDLELSPRSLWQAHTPQRIARALADVLAQAPAPRDPQASERPRSADELLAMLLPDAHEGLIVVDAWRLTPAQGQRIHEWIESGAGTDRGPLAGIRLERMADRGVQLSWEPEVLLSEAERKAHGVSQAWRWARRLAEGLDLCLSGEDLDLALLPESERSRRRERVWRALLPTAFARPIQGLAPELVLPLRATLEEQGVAPWQMRVAYARDRVYPAGEQELFGSWGYVEQQATEPAPRAGLELLCDRLLASRACAFLERRPERYAWIADRPVRGARANGYVEFAPGSAPPVVRTTLDLGLQRFLGQELEHTLAEQRAALAMGIVLDVASGEVLAVDSREAYPMQPFAPVYHQFTTGSTFKVLTMATALEAGLVTPDDVLDVGQGEYRIVYPDGRPSGRVIREAEGALTGRHTAREFFAYSVNAALAQIGLRVPDTRFRATLEALGYGRPPQAGLGPEQAGSLAPLPWKYAYTHASIGFGHEISTTLWTHAAGLAAVVRGGLWRPLRLLDSVSQEERRVEVERDPGRRVFSAATCEAVRDMMRLGASEGTGREVGQSLRRTAAAALGIDEADLVLDLGSKTGTAQKVSSEVCLHVELAERERRGSPGTREELLRLAKPHPRCYTSSICVFGRAPTSEREIMVLIVVDEPRGKERFGGRVAGPAAARVLAEALALTHGGRLPTRDVVDGFAATDLLAESLAEGAWRASR